MRVEIILRGDTGYRIAWEGEDADIRRAFLACVREHGAPLSLLAQVYRLSQPDTPAMRLPGYHERGLRIGDVVRTGGFYYYEFERGYEGVASAMSVVEVVRFQRALGELPPEPPEPEFEEPDTIPPPPWLRRRS